MNIGAESLDLAIEIPRTMVRVDDDVAHAAAAKSVDHMREHRPIADGHERLRDLVAERTKPRTEPRRKHHGRRHDSLPIVYQLTPTRESSRRDAAFWSRARERASGRACALQASRSRRACSPS